MNCSNCGAAMSLVESVVKGDDAAPGVRRDLAQRVLDGRPCQVGRHALPQEERRPPGIESRSCQPAEPVLLLEIGGDERDTSRVDAGFLQRLFLEWLAIQRQLDGIGQGLLAASWKEIGG
jgi:hypothetical protein